MTDNRLRQIYRIACLGLAFLLGALAGVCAFRIVSDKQADDPFKDFSVPAHEESGDYNVYADLMVFNELYKLIETRYAGEFDPDEAMQAALEQYVASLNDPYSVYMTNDQADSFIDGDFGKKVGIGVRIYRM